MFPFFLFQTEATKDSYMPLLPSARLTVDIEVEEQVAPMYDGALLVPSFGHGAVPCTCRKCKTRAISISTFWPLEYVGYVRVYVWKDGCRYEGRQEVPFDVYTAYDVAAIPLPWYEGDMVGLVSGASEHVYTAWYALAGDE